MLGAAANAAPDSPFEEWSQPAPAFALADANGAVRSLPSAFDGVTLVHFFATWCEPCRAELPPLQRFARRAGTRVRIVAVSVAEPEIRVRRFLDANRVDFDVLIDRDRAMTRAWRVSELPSTIALGRDLRARLAAQTSVEWDAIEPAAFVRDVERESTRGQEGGAP